MKAEEARRIADQALQNLTDAFKSGKSERITQHLAMLAKFHRYSFGNVLLIFSQMPVATHVAGFGTWKQMGRFVKKGEKGIVMIAPMNIRPRSTSNAPTSRRSLLDSSTPRQGTAGVSFCSRAVLSRCSEASGA